MNPSLDLYPAEKNPQKKLVNMNEDYYLKEIVDGNGKIVAKKPHFVTFINSKLPHSNMIQEGLQHLAHYYQGDI